MGKDGVKLILQNVCFFYISKLGGGLTLHIGMEWSNTGFNLLLTYDQKALGLFLDFCTTSFSKFRFAFRINVFTLFLACVNLVSIFCITPRFADILRRCVIFLLRMASCNDLLTGTHPFSLHVGIFDALVFGTHPFSLYFGMFDALVFGTHPFSLHFGLFDALVFGTHPFSLYFGMFDALVFGTHPFSLHFGLFDALVFGTHPFSLYFGMFDALVFGTHPFSLHCGIP